MKGRFQYDLLTLKNYIRFSHALQRGNLNGVLIAMASCWPDMYDMPFSEMESILKEFSEGLEQYQKQCQNQKSTVQVERLIASVFEGEPSL